MQIDRQELSAHYASLSDQELLELDRAELTEVAQRFYDSELAKRHLTPEDTETPVEPHGRAAPVDAAEGGRPRPHRRAAPSLSPPAPVITVRRGPPPAHTESDRHRPPH